MEAGLESCTQLRIEGFVQPHEIFCTTSVASSGITIFRCTALSWVPAWDAALISILRPNVTCDCLVNISIVTLCMPDLGQPRSETTVTGISVLPDIEAH